MCAPSVTCVSGLPNSRTGLGSDPGAAASRPQTAGKDHSSPDGAEREAAAHAAHLLQRQPEAGRPDEGAAGGDDGPESAGDPGLVPEQALQGQEEEPADEAAPAAADQRQNGAESRTHARTHARARTQTRSRLGQLCLRVFNRPGTVSRGWGLGGGGWGGGSVG